MAPKTATQKSLSFKAQSKPKSSFSASAKDQIKAKSTLKSTSTPTKPLTTSLRKSPPQSTTKDESNSKRAPLDVDDPRWDALWRKTKKTINVPPSKSVHIDHEDRVHQILRVFDLDPNYGPCMGMSRLERWQRAKDLDLDPPQEVYDILTTKQGVSEHKENVFTSHGL